jgi:hypothetical protein
MVFHRKLLSLAEAPARENTSLINRLLNWLVFGAYSVFVTLGGTRHEPWFDEAQAWLIARDASYRDMAAKIARYEGSPVLWHLLLSVPAKLHMPYYMLTALSLLFAAGAVFLLLKYSPFPLIMKLLLPFTFFLSYQFAVVARSYVLISFFLASIAAIFKKRKEHPYIYLLLLLLLANTSVHGLIIACSFYLLDSIASLKRWKNLERKEKKDLLITLALFLMVILFLVCMLYPAEDNALAPGLVFSFPIFVKTFAYAVRNSFAENWVLSFLVFISSLVFFWAKKRLSFYLLPFAGLICLFSFKYFQPWHEGVLFLLWVFALWVSFESKETRIKNPNLMRSLSLIMVVLAILVALVQIKWTINSYKYDLEKDYSAARRAADFIKEYNLDKERIFAINFHSISILPYFDRNIFINHNGGKNVSFWLWSSEHNSMIQDADDAYKDMVDNIALIPDYDPEIIVLGIKRPFQWKLTDIPSYKQISSFPGALYWKNRLMEEDSFIIYGRE